MNSDTSSKEAETSKEKPLVERLRRFVENSHLGFYGTAMPHTEQLDTIEKFLKG